MLSTEPQIIANYADTGLIRYVYYPMLDHGPTRQTYEAAECAGEQNAEAFWTIHDLFYEEQDRLFRPNTELYLEFAQRAGVPDPRSAAGIRLRPSFSIDGQLIPGAQSFQQLSQLIAAALLD